MDNQPLKTRLLAEFIGTAMLLIAVVGSGIMAETLSPNDTGLQLLEAAFAAGFALMAIILTLQPISGAHINPAVTLAERFMGGMSTAKPPATSLPRCPAPWSGRSSPTSCSSSLR